MIVEKLINNFNENGISNIALLQDIKKINLINFTLKNFITKWKETNMAYSLYQADKWLTKYKCIVSYGDIFAKKALKNLMLDKNLISVSYDSLEKFGKWGLKTLDDAETFKINKKNIIEIGKRKVILLSGQYMGLMKFEPRGWKIFKKCLKNFNNFKNYIWQIFCKSL